MTPWSSHPHPSKCHRGCQGLRAGRAVRAGVGPAALGGSWPCRGSSPAVLVTRTQQQKLQAPSATEMTGRRRKKSPVKICSLLLNIHVSYWQTLEGSVLLSKKMQILVSMGQATCSARGWLWLLCLCAVMWLWVPKVGQGPLLSWFNCASGTVLAECTEELKARRLLTHVSIALLSSGR